MRRSVVIMLVAGLVAGLSLVVSQLRIGKSTCVSQFGPCSGEVNELVRKQERNLWWRAIKEMKRDLGGNKWVKEFSIRYKALAEMRVRVVERKAEAALAEDNGKYSLWSGDGVVLGEAAETQLPVVIVGDEELGTDEKAFAAELIHEMFLWKGIRSGEVKERGLKIRIAEDKEMILPLEGDLDVLLGKANLILSWLNSDSAGTRITLVDLRYRNPVVR